MQAGKAENPPTPPTQLVTLLMQTLQLYARNAVRTSVNVAVDEAGCTIAGKRSCPNSFRGASPSAVQ
jgi:hypothetical protein